jgi:hypothetical protein
MLLVKNDSFDKDSIIVHIFFILAMFGIYDITSEIVDENLQIFSKNFFKKTVLFAAIYVKLKSVYEASVISIILILMFPHVFFGPPTHPRIKSGGPKLI